MRVDWVRIVKLGANLIIPLGGVGRRFSNEGYLQPKPLIKVLGKPILFWTLDSLKLESDDRILIPYHHSLDHYNFPSIMKKSYPHARLLRIPRDTKGAAETVMFALKEMDDHDLSKKTICLDGDTFYDCDVVSLSKEFDFGGVFSFDSVADKPIYSYVKVDSNGIIEEIKEKQKISNRANTGCYVFNTGHELKQYASRSIEEYYDGNSELYISTIISRMLSDGHLFHNVMIDKDQINVLGTPYQVRLFASENSHRSEKLRFCFDLDNTLVTYPRIKDDYTTCDPIEANIKILKQLKEMGHTIIIHTARRMRTHSGNIGAVIADIGSLTIATLEKFEIPYDELIFGKPYANFYIDDLGISTASNISQEIGFHKNDIKERDFNEVTAKQIDVIIKNSRKKSILDGEIFWYENIPKSIVNLFPKYIGKNDGGGYIIEKIRGIPASKLYSDGLLTKDNLYEIIASIEKIHSSSYSRIMEDSIDIHANYIPKLTRRYESEDYSIFTGHKKFFEYITTKLGEYTQSGKSTKCVIHGDPVLRNILLADDGSVKFIDMRGEIGGNLSIIGDKWYDFAKLYQSLDGYDEILNGSFLDIEYKNDLKAVFRDYVEANYSKEILSWIEILKESLVFSLLPLHPEEKALQYYKLIS